MATDPARTKDQGPVRLPPVPHDRQARTGTLLPAGRSRTRLRPVHVVKASRRFAWGGEEALLDQRAFNGKTKVDAKYLAEPEPAPAASSTAHPATDRGQSPCRATAWQRCAASSRRAPPPEPRSGKAARCRRCPPSSPPAAGTPPHYSALLVRVALAHGAFAPVCARERESTACQPSKALHGDLPRPQRGLQLEPYSGFAPRS